MLFMLVFLFVFTPVIIVNVWLNSQFLRNDAQVHDTLFGYLDLLGSTRICFDATDGSSFGKKKQKKNPPSVLGTFRFA